MSVEQVLFVSHRHKTMEFRITEDGGLELHMDGCLRKRRDAGQREPQYVWTNVELEWEEHHYIEARYWASRDTILVTVNGETLADGRLAELTQQ